jgi:hypothetical protein
MDKLKCKKILIILSIIALYVIIMYIVTKGYMRDGEHDGFERFLLAVITFSITTFAFTVTMLGLLQLSNNMSIL